MVFLGKAYENTVISRNAFNQIISKLRLNVMSALLDSCPTLLESDVGNIIGTICFPSNIINDINFVFNFCNGKMKVNAQKSDQMTFFESLSELLNTFFYTRCILAIERFFSYLIQPNFYSTHTATIPWMSANENVIGCIRILFFSSLCENRL